MLQAREGSSAGVTLAVALLSALTGQVARVDVAMSGELTLRAHDRVGGRHCGEVAGSVPSADDHDAPAGNEAHVAESFGDELPGGIREPARPGASRPALAGAAGACAARQAGLPANAGRPVRQRSAFDDIRRRAARPSPAGGTAQIWSNPLSNRNENVGREPAPAGPPRPTSITSAAALAAHLGRELSAAVDGHGWTDLHYAAALD